MDFLIVLALLLVVVLVIGAPLRRARRPVGEAAAREQLQAERDVAELEAARDAKYREIRDAQLDRDTGKLSEPDFARLDGELRAEAIELLKRLDRAQRALQDAERRGLGGERGGGEEARNAPDEGRSGADEAHGD